jgi:head-tail adaptor
MIGAMNREVEIRQRTRAQSTTDGSYTDTWTTLATVWAEVQDILAGKAERIANDIDMSRRPSRVRFYWREDVTTEMRFRVLGRSTGEATRDMRIISGPAELGFRDRVEFIAEDVTTEGQEP